MVNKISDLIKPDDPAQSIGLNQQQTSGYENAPEPRVMARLWKVLGQTFPTFAAMCGEAPTEAWERQLTGVTPDQIKDGLNRLSERDGKFPPSAVEFRHLCLGVKIDKNGHDITHQHKSAAHIPFSDPRHPWYEKKQIESDEIKGRKEQRAKQEIGKLKDMFKMTTKEILDRINKCETEQELSAEMDKIQLDIENGYCSYGEKEADMIERAAKSKLMYIKESIDI